MCSLINFLIFCDFLSYILEKFKKLFCFPALEPIFAPFLVHFMQLCCLKNSHFELMYAKTTKKGGDGEQVTSSDLHPEGL